MGNGLLSKHQAACEGRLNDPRHSGTFWGRLIGSTGLALAQSDVAAAQWPDRPIRFVVPFPAGAATHAVARIVAQRMGAILGQTVVVENRVGASGTIGTEAVAKAAPDGYTIGFATATTHPIAASLSPHLGYDPIKDFTPVSTLGSTPYSLVGWKGLPVKTVADLVAYAKTHPYTVAYSSVGPESPAHLARSCLPPPPASSSSTCPTKARARPYSISSKAAFRFNLGWWLRASRRYVKAS